MSISTEQAYGLFPHLIAYVDNVDGSTVAANVATWVNESAADTHAFLYAILEYVSGTLGICEGKATIQSDPITSVAALANLDADHRLVVGHNDVLGQQIIAGASLKWEVTTASAGASVFNVKFYGLSL